MSPVFHAKRSTTCSSSDRLANPSQEVESWRALTYGVVGGEACWLWQATVCFKTPKQPVTVHTHQSITNSIALLFVNDTCQPIYDIIDRQLAFALTPFRLIQLRNSMVLVLTTEQCLRGTDFKLGWGASDEQGKLGVGPPFHMLTICGSCAGVGLF